MTCTAVTPEMWADLVSLLIWVVPLVSVSALLVGQFIWFGGIAPWITRRVSAWTVEMMQNEEALDKMVEHRIRLRQRFDRG